MTKPKAAEAVIAPNYPNAVIDFDTVHANDAKGKTGDALFAGAIVKPAAAEEVPEPEPAPVKDAAPAPKPAA